MVAKFAVEILILDHVSPDDQASRRMQTDRWHGCLWFRVLIKALRDAPDVPVSETAVPRCLRNPADSTAFGRHA